jgi:hypothetical protein
VACSCPSTCVHKIAANRHAMFKIQRGLSDNPSAVRCPKFTYGPQPSSTAMVSLATHMCDRPYRHQEPPVPSLLARSPGATLSSCSLLYRVPIETFSILERWKQFRAGRGHSVPDRINQFPQACSTVCHRSANRRLVALDRSHRGWEGVPGWNQPAVIDDAWHFRHQSV